MNTPKRLILGLLTSLLLITPSVARANTYTVEGCGTVGTGAFTFSSNLPAAFDFGDYGCNASTSITFGGLSGDAGDTYSQGQEGSWGVSAPAGESVTGVGLYDADSTAVNGWLVGWTLNGEVDQNALPANDDCLGYSGTECGESASGWYAVPGAESVQAMLVCDAAAFGIGTCTEPPGSTDSVATIHDAVVQIADPGTAVPQVSGSLWSLGQGVGLTGGWVSGTNAGTGFSLSFQASDPGGVCTLEAVLLDASGDAVASSKPVAQTPQMDSASEVASTERVGSPFVSTEPCGATSTDISTFAPNVASLPTGTYYLNVEAQNPGDYQAGTYAYAAGDSLTGGEQINIDNSIPSVTVTPASSGESVGVLSGSWASAPESVTVAATDAAGSSGLAEVTCTTPAGTSTYPVSGDQASVVVNVPTPGADFADCDATSVAGNTSAVVSTSFNVDAQTPTVSYSGATGAPGWNGANPTVTATGGEAVQASGIANVTCQVDGGGWATTPGSVANLTVDGDGSHEVSCFSTTIAGLTALPPQSRCRWTRSHRRSA